MFESPSCTRGPLVSIPVRNPPPTPPHTPHTHPTMRQNRVLAKNPLPFRVILWHNTTGLPLPDQAHSTTGRCSQPSHGRPERKGEFSWWTHSVQGVVFGGFLV